MQEEIGTVVSTPLGPSPSQLDFVVTKGIVHKGAFVEVEYSEGTMVCLITNVIKTNRYFERADSVKEFEATGAKIFEQFPTTEWEYLLAQTRPLGVFQEGKIKRASYPPSPGAKVKIATADNLKKFLGFDEETGLLLGEVEYHSLPVKLNLTRLFRKHLAVLAMSGAGKSYLVSVILEELLSRKKEQGRIATILLDVHGEYSSFAEALPASDKKHVDYSKHAKIVRARDIRIGVSKLSVGMLAGIIPGLSSTQKRDLGKIISKLQKEMRSGLGPYDLNAIRTELMADNDIKENTKMALFSWLYGLEDLHLFDKTDEPSISDLVKPGQLTIVDLSDIVNMKKKQIIVSYFGQKLFNERRQKRLPPFVMILEEAHQFCPEKASQETAISRSIIRTIAREGRKFGASICIISQRPVHLDTTTLSQCNTHIILRITNPYDLKHIGESSESLDSKSIEMINSLRVGEALLVGEATNYPVFFKVRERKSLESRHEMPLEQAAIEFEEGKAKQEKETEEFL